MIIRNAEKTELPFIREQRIISYKEHAERIPKEHWKALRQAITSEVDTQTGVELLVAEMDGEIMGSVALFPAKIEAYEGYIDALEYPEIRLLAVNPEMRGNGIARALIMECIYRAKFTGYHSVGLHTAEFMKNAIRLYEGLGFEHISQFDFVPLEDGIVVRAYRLGF